jgi:hypothetical protein
MFGDEGYWMRCMGLGIWELFHRKRAIACIPFEVSEVILSIHGTQAGARNYVYKA